MTGWLLIISLLVLGGILSTLGDLLGSRVGKARLSIFNLRPRRTAVVITVLTGSLISALSLGFMLLVSRQLRVGLFELDDLQIKLKNSRLALAPLQKERKRLEARIDSGERELKQLERNLIALRRGEVVITSGQNLATATIELQESSQSRKAIETLLQQANLYAYRKVRPRERPNRQIILVPTVDINKLEKVLLKKGKWVATIRSAGNVLLGEKLVYAFPEVRPNKNIVRKGEVISTTILKSSELTMEGVSKGINLLLASSLAEIKRRGSITSELKFNSSSINSLANELSKMKRREIELEVVALLSSETADPVIVGLQKSNPIRGILRNKR